jgi:polar amino acid transport system substrate-binding protein
MRDAGAKVRMPFISARPVLARGRFALALLIAVSGAEAAAKETISLCYENQDVRPWRTASGSGLNFDMLRQVASELNITFDFVSAPWKRCLAEVQANKINGVFAISYSTGRRAIGEFPGGTQVDRSKRMLTDRFVLVRLKGAPIDWDGKQFHNVDGAIGIQLGYSVGAFLAAQNVRVDEGNPNPAVLVQKLMAGRVAAIAVGASHAAALMSGPHAADIEVLPVPLIEKQYYLMLSHAFVAANPKLAERIWSAIEEVRNSAAYIRQQEAAGDTAHD